MGKGSHKREHRPIICRCLVCPGGVGWGGYVSSDDNQVSLAGVGMSRGFFVADKGNTSNVDISDISV